MATCPRCGSHISDSFERVFSDPETGEVRACPSCPDLSVPEEYANEPL